jgi:hypothetical protein
MPEKKYMEGGGGRERGGEERREEGEEEGPKKNITSAPMHLSSMAEARPAGAAPTTRTLP